ncbi:zinc finger protein 541-like isoform X1 [Scyliorhinus canicula]|uniref:zinc finger protein 541-like isoform X1 n=1 Tax=Scyliorhinus canicula TaxID=7830 RepID=UPI0018F38FC9|nr:zinc finger protein 541-like isoform X1 [Scyliorhinus canicula]XP_038641918.1 zinc finger protein 541-like isoform X1 [Scyliorhinus canicula]XP_038641919.1 zinc finger protein 541-like isoform X1 [Scyliorhinus canicula]
MDCYSFTDESSLQTEMHLPLLSDSELPIASNIQRQEFISDPDDIIYAGMTSIELDSNLEAAEIPGDPFADNVDLSLYTVDKGCDSPKIPSDSTDTDSPPMLLGISPLPQKSTPEKGASKSEGKYGGLQKRRRLSARHSPQQAFQECSQCGKSFSSASALSKHYLTHSHERRHVCRICNKAFKRQDHLSGHLLTHQKNKPYVCMEHGCDKSYCDSRSLRRHYEVQHGLYCQREPFADSSSKDVDSTESMLYLQSGHTQTLQCEVGMAQRPTPQVESLSQRSTLPNRELLRPLTSSLSQKMPCDTRASGSKITLHYPTQTHATASVLTSPSICLSERSGTVRQSKYSIMQREHSSSLNCNMSDPYNRVNSSHFSVADPTVSCVESLDSYVVDSVIPGRPSQPAQYALESSRPASWPQAVSTNHTLSRNETVSARQQPSQDLVWTNNLATYSGSKGSYSYIVPNSQPPEEVSATFSSGALHKLDSFAQAFTRQNLDIQSNSSTAKSQGENSAVSEFDACGNVFRQLLSYKANLNQWQTFPEQKHQILQEQYSLQHQQQIATSLFTQVYMGEQEASPVQNQDQFQNHMLQLISDTQYNLSQSQNSVSQSQVLVTQSQHVLAQKIPSQIQNNGSQSHHPSELAQDFQHSLRQETTSPFLQFQTAKQCQLSKNILPCYPQETESTEQQTGPGLQPALRSVSECHKKSKKSPFKAQHTPQSVCEEDVVPNQLQSPSEQQLEGWSLPPCSNKRGRISNKDVCIKHYTVTGKSSKSVSVSRKERQKLDPNCTAPPSQVAMNSFSVQNSLPRSMEDYLQKASFHASVQGEDIYSLSSMPQEGDASSAVLCRDLVSSSTSQNLDENEENFRCERCQGVFHFLKGLNCHTCPREGMGKQHSLEDGVKSQKVTDNGIEKMEHGGLFFQYLEDKLSALLLKKPLEESVAMPLVIPVSVPVKSAGSKKDGKPVKSENSPVTPRKSVTTRLTDLIVSSNDSSAQVTETGKQANVNCRGHSKKQRRKRSRPEPLFIPSPASNQTGVLPGMVLYQSHMRSPVCLADHLLEKNFQPPPYTPPPMLSPIRHGSGLYFNRICSLPGSKVPHTTYTPKGILGSVVDGVDGIYGISVVKDDSIITIEPHINIGTRFQAEIPLLQDKSLVDDRVHQADLVWKPWDDIETNKVTQARVTDLLNLACSSVLPGGGTNLELALHCLHDTRGDILAALEVLLMKGVRRDPCHPLGDYHYTGTEKWTTAEKKMFNKAICLHNKDFFLMQKMIKYKTVAQCVEYYYTWKKQLKFEWKRTHLLEEEEIKRETDSPADGKEIKKLSFIASQGLSIPSQTSVSREKLKKKIVRSKPSPSPSVHCQTGAQDKNEKKFILGNFPCKECTKVFDKVKSRNAHMKCHRQQEEQERQAEMKRSRIRLKVEPKEEPEETILVFTSNNLSNITTP